MISQHLPAKMEDAYRRQGESAGVPSRPGCGLPNRATRVTGTGSTGGADYVNDLLSYAQPLLPGLQVNNLGCGGETTTTMLHGGDCTKYATGSQLGDAEGPYGRGGIRDHRYRRG